MDPCITGKGYFEPVLLHRVRIEEEGVYIL
ncbi:hypothetical protein KMAL_29720 [Novacetimonas maltaceti]|uniref:Uncharacterized protein n=1 Tax=Novacetimonas maltaceti TaxID=1203393 RepID=A0A2S3VXQ4_9PROT|nr:hypothetical protein KMAL_29720 [Novacetimonas maltaceti]